MLKKTVWIFALLARPGQRGLALHVRPQSTNQRRGRKHARRAPTAPTVHKGRICAPVKRALLGQTVDLAKTVWQERTRIHQGLERALIALLASTHFHLVLYRKQRAQIAMLESTTRHPGVEPLKIALTVTRVSMPRHLPRQLVRTVVLASTQDL